MHKTTLTHALTWAGAPGPTTIRGVRHGQPSAEHMHADTATDPPTVDHFRGEKAHSPQKLNNQPQGPTAG